MKLRCSFSLLSMWRRGQFDMAVNSYLHRELPMNQAMSEGIMWDQHITEWVDLYKRLPDEFGGDELLKPKTQEKIIVPYNDMCDLVILPDILDGNMLWENKTGDSKDSADYAIDFQIAMYFLGCELSGRNIDMALINHYNQHTNELDRTLVWKTPQELERGRNFIETLAPEIHNYFSENGIFELDKEAKEAYNSKYDN